ncbi:protein of unknown function [Methylotuvimicrobium alcaliphilum 20Z]|uniref:Uncharacterized protein n=1 Tax=Methylotuvimicrobium alcaliphilum (strain DSM 19304 / NCIMB 14124 / VKM B-2133 / 20Z) TaxID=1091494 RepID=G4SYK7_META2|nr:protein of unknown function [Methylotuvimicrobium alcaliphilum 20Z]
MNGQPGAIPVYLCHQDKRIEGVVHAMPLPPEQARKHAAKRNNARVIKVARRAKRP